MHVTEAITSCSGPSALKLQHLHVVSKRDALSLLHPFSQYLSTCQCKLCYLPAIFLSWLPVGDIAWCLSLQVPGYQIWSGGTLNTQGIHPDAVCPVGSQQNRQLPRVAEGCGDQGRSFQHGHRAGTGHYWCCCELPLPHRPPPWNREWAVGDSVKDSKAVQAFHLHAQKGCLGRKKVVWQQLCKR